ncbi:hypothetical protein EXE53_11995 [Halorubrum sp. SD626R]|uniref:hypothetical protein n=1 Tax=Halorubrum sp. SD626R TaxID=1419722 RepID=UPI0010F69ABD|nr:hypothetical protein [Halorubrum sp. SD626R]TKX80118.1 hypothetical protein EXE53_11995 [Halorubrum sp. SD626R]
MANRRSVLIGLGGLVAGGGAILSTGAFDTVEAERTVSIETADDADALLGLEPADRDGDGGNAYVTQDGGTISITLGGDGEDENGVNQNARTTFRDLVVVTNQGSQTVETLGLEFTDAPDDVTLSDTFSFPVDEFDGDGAVTVEHPDDSAANILTGDGDIPSSLEPGDAVVFGLEIDLIDGGDGNDLPEDAEFTLTITAEASESS